MGTEINICLVFGECEESQDQGEKNPISRSSECTYLEFVWAAPDPGFMTFWFTEAPMIFN